MIRADIHYIIFRSEMKIDASFFCYFRNRKFYGKSVVEGIQHPGETLYMPHYINHAVYNLDQTVAVGDNPFFTTAIEESVFELHNKKRTEYGFMNESVAYIHQGKLKFPKHSLAVRL